MLAAGILWIFWGIIWFAFDGTNITVPQAIGNFALILLGAIMILTDFIRRGLNDIRDAIRDRDKIQS